MTDRAETTDLPLSGIRVLDLTVVIAGPIATAKLGDMGAEVIRVESIQELGTGGRVPIAKTTREQVQGHPAQRRTFPDGDPGLRPWNRSAMFNSHACNKLSMTVDLRKPEGMEVLARLVKKSDVLIENHATDFVERRGFTYDWLREQKPDIIMVRMPGFGLDGPYAYWRTFGSTAEGHAGRSILRPPRSLGSTLPTQLPEQWRLSLRSWRYTIATARGRDRSSTLPWRRTSCTCWDRRSWTTR